MQRQVNEVTERQTNRISRIGFWRGLSTFEYPHIHVYLRNVCALVILYGVVPFYNLGVAQSEIPPPRRFNEVNETRNLQKSESESERQSNGKEQIFLCTTCYGRNGKRSSGTGWAF